MFTAAEAVEYPNGHGVFRCHLKRAMLVIALCFVFIRFKNLGTHTSGLVNTMSAILPLSTPKLILFSPHLSPPALFELMLCYLPSLLAIIRVVLYPSLAILGSV